MDVDHNRGHLSVLRFGPPGVARPVRSRSRSPTSAARASRGLPQRMLRSPTPASRHGGSWRWRGRSARSRTATSSRPRRCRWTRQSWCEATSTATSGWRPGCFSPDPDSLEDAVIDRQRGGQQLHRARRADDQDARARGRAKLDHGSPRPGLRPADVRAAAAGRSATPPAPRSGNGIRADLDQAASFMHVVRYRPEANAGLVSSASNSGDDSELAGGLDVIGEDHVSVYSQPVSDLAPGDTLGACPRCRSRRPTTARPFTAPRARGRSVRHSGTPLQADNLTEVNPYMGKLPIHDSTAWTVPGGVSGSGFVNLVMWSTCRPWAPRPTTRSRSPQTRVG